MFKTFWEKVVVNVESQTYTAKVSTKSRNNS